MSKANLEGRQADIARPDDFNLGGFDDDGRSVVKKTYTSGKPADKPGFFLGGSDPTVPTGPKVKLRTNWMTNSSSDTPQRVEHVPKPHKKWTPAGSGTGKKGLPKRCQSHDGTMAAGTTFRKGKKKPAFATKKAEENDEVKAGEVEETKTEQITDEAEKTKKEEHKEEPVDEEPRKETETETAPAPAPTWEPPKVVIRKSVIPTEEDRKEQEKMMETADTSAAASASTVIDADKDALIAKQAAEIEALKAEKGELAKQVKKIKGSQQVNTELKEQVFELQQQLKAKDKQDANSKGFTKLENKLNTLKMVVDGNVNKNNLEELQEHVSMINMVLNQDLRKEGMKNVWA